MFMDIISICIFQIEYEVILFQVPDYNVIITKPMDLSTMMSKIDRHHYQSASDFMADIDLICRNALEYNPATDPAG